MSDLSLFYCDTATFGESAPNIQQVCRRCGVWRVLKEAAEAAAVRVDGRCFCALIVFVLDAGKSAAAFYFLCWAVYAAHRRRCTRTVTVQQCVKYKSCYFGPSLVLRYGACRKRADKTVRRCYAVKGCTQCATCSWSSSPGSNSRPGPTATFRRRRCIPSLGESGKKISSTYQNVARRAAEPFMCSPPPPSISCGRPSTHALHVTSAH